MVPVSYRVARRRQETHDSWTLELEPVREELAPLAPGQFAMLYVFGKGEVPISVSRLPQIHTIRAVGSVSAALTAPTARIVWTSGRALIEIGSSPVPKA